MPILQREQFFDSVRKVIGDRSDPDAVSFLEDMTDTYDALEKGVKGDGIDYKKMYEENDKAWATRYRERFLRGDGGAGPSPSAGSRREEFEAENITFSDLFKK